MNQMSVVVRMFQMCSNSVVTCSSHHQKCTVKRFGIHKLKHQCDWKNGVNVWVRVRARERERKKSLNFNTTHRLNAHHKKISSLLWKCVTQQINIISVRTALSDAAKYKHKPKHFLRVDYSVCVCMCAAVRVDVRVCCFSGCRIYIDFHMMHRIFYNDTDLPRASNIPVNFCSERMRNGRRRKKEKCKREKERKRRWMIHGDDVTTPHKRRLSIELCVYDFSMLVLILTI